MRINTFYKVIIDNAIVVFALFFVIVYKNIFGLGQFNYYLFLIVLFLTVTSSLFANWIANSYNRNWKYFGYYDFIDFYKSQILFLLIILCISIFFKKFPFQVLDCFIIVLLSSQLQLAARWMSRFRLINKIFYSDADYRAVILGFSDQTENFIRNLIINNNLNYNVICIYDVLGQNEDQIVHRIPIKSKKRLVEDLNRKRIETVIFDSSLSDENLLFYKDCLSQKGISFISMNDFEAFVAHNQNKSNSFSHNIKKVLSYDIPIRIIDFLSAALLLLLLAPLFVIICIFKLFDDGRPIFFRQYRYGKYLKLFQIYKFRTMDNDAEAQQVKNIKKIKFKDPVIKSSGSRYITKFGAFLRKYSIDELPQIVNIVLGQMSFVGPRPLVTMEIDLYSRQQLNDLKLRFSVKPGLTGLSQISGRSNLSFNKIVEKDLYFVKNRSLVMYFKIIFRTIPIVIQAKNNY